MQVGRWSIVAFALVACEGPEPAPLWMVVEDPADCPAWVLVESEDWGEGSELPEEMSTRGFDAQGRLAWIVTRNFEHDTEYRRRVIWDDDRVLVESSAATGGPASAPGTPTTRLTYDLDGEGRVVRHWNPAQTEEYAYGEHGLTEIVATTWDDVVTRCEYERDSGGRVLAEVCGEARRTFTWREGRLVAEHRDGQLVMELTWSGELLVERSRQRPGAPPRYWERYQYANDRLASVERGNDEEGVTGRETFTYEGGRLVERAFGATATMRFGYDEAGRLTSENGVPIRYAHAGDELEVTVGETEQDVRRYRCSIRPSVEITAPSAPIPEVADPRSEVTPEPSP